MLLLHILLMIKNISKGRDSMMNTTKFRNGLIAVLLFLCLISLWNICKPTKTTKEETSTKKLVYLVLDVGGVHDGSFNESAYKGAKQAEKELDIEVKYLESKTEADYASNIETAIDNNADLVIGVGFNLSNAIEKAAKGYPDQQFAIVDGSFKTIPDNVSVLLFNESQAAYLAGMVTALTVESNKFGFIGGYEMPAVVSYKEGFEEGLKAINPNATLQVQYANSFTDAAKGKSIAQQMYMNGVECIMTAAGGVNNGVYEAGLEKSKFAVGVDSAQSSFAPKTIVTSALKNVDVGVNKAINNFIDGTLQGGKSVVYDLSNDGIGYEKTDLISNETIKKIEEILNK